MNVFRRARPRNGALPAVLPLALSAFALVAAGLVLATPAQAQTEMPGVSSLQARHPNATCYETQVPVSVPGIPRAHIYGQLCVPKHGEKSNTVQLLVPGATYDHNYFDWPQNSDRYSYVTQALNAGYSTFNVDRLGTGRSTLPPSALSTVPNQSETLHQVISRLRTGKIKHQAFGHVVWVGHSLGSVEAWYEAQKHRDIDAFVLTGARYLPDAPPAEPGDDSGPSLFIKAMDDPKFKGRISDPGYLTTAPGMGFRGLGFYYAPNAEQSVIDEDERLKQVTTESETSIGETLTDPPDKAISRNITVPTLIAVGDHDVAYCGPDGNPICTPEKLTAIEKPYFTAQARLHVIVAANSGHDIQLHKNARQTDAAILGWISSVAPAHQK